jgi:hypothetical protein
MRLTDQVRQKPGSKSKIQKRPLQYARLMALSKLIPFAQFGRRLNSQAGLRFIDL